MTYLLDALAARAGEFISLRRDIHRHPELAFQAHRTAADDFNDDNIATDSACWVLLAERLLATKEPAAPR